MNFFFKCSVLLTCCTAALSANAIDFLDFARLPGKKIERSCHNQNAFKLLDAIPLELQNLPYATYPNDPAYNTFRFNFNKRFNVFPKAIIAPRTFEEAQYVFNALKVNALDFSIRSGGHCFEPGSLSSEYIFDLNNFNSIIPDIPSERVYIGSGCLLNNVIATLGAIGYAIPTGTCPTVCVTGLTLGGGIGLLVRSFGLTCDSVVSITLLTAKGEVIEVSENNYPDLFWALRGGGNGSYGIVLGWTFKMHAVPVCSFYELAWDFDKEKAYCIIRTWQKWVAKLPSTINSSIRLEYREGTIVIRIIGLKIGSDPFTEWKKAFSKCNPRIRIEQGSYLSTVPLWSSQPSLPFNKSKSKILLEPISKKVTKDIVRYLESLNQNKQNLRIFLNFDAFGGNLFRFESAFPFRKAFGWWYFAAYWPYQTQDALAKGLIDEIYNEVSPHVSKYSYANATDYDLGRKYLKAYYNQNVNRLIEIKNKYDPENCFKWKQSIPTHLFDAKEES